MAAAWLPASQGSLWVCALLGLVTYRLSRLVSDVFWSPLAAVPGPKARAASRLPLAWSIVRGTLVRDAHDLHRRYGPVVRIGPNDVSLAAEESWQQVFHGHEQRFLKDPVWSGDQPGLPTNIATAVDPERHKPLRRAIAPCFAPDAIKTQEPAIQTYVDLLIERLRGVVRDGDGTAVVDVLPWLNFTTFDIFGALFLGRTFDCLSRSDYHPWIALLFNSIKLVAFIAAARLFPVGQFLLLRCIPPALRRAQTDHYGVIADRVRARLAMKDGEASDLMAHLLRRGDRRNVPEEEFTSTIMFMTIAGSETTATTLAGTIQCLANNQDKFETLAREVRTRLGTIEGVTPDAVNGLPYLEAVLKEGLRLCPAVPSMLPRIVPEGGEVVCGTWLPGGTSVVIQPYTMSRDPNYFHEAASFIPERWLCEQSGSGEEDPEAAQPLSPFASDHRGVVQAFGMGPRHCPGKGLAWAEMRLIMAKLVWAFDMLPLEEGAATPSWVDQRVFVLIEKNPIRVRLRERTDAGGFDKVPV